MNNKTIGERIRAARKAKGLSQEQLGEKLDISFQAVSSWETGKFIRSTMTSGICSPLSKAGRRCWD